MEIREYQEDDLRRLFEYWRKVGTGIPYFFPVSAPQWQACLLEDRLDGERIFSSLETYVATEEDKILGFAQSGHPNFAWDEGGQKYRNPHVGVVRHLYFDKERQDAGEALLAAASEHLAAFGQVHAFYHILGMSCNAHHGKLHDSQSHVEQLLEAHGFRLEHENVYYVLDVECTTPAEEPQLHLRCVPGSGEQSFEIRRNAAVVGTARVRYLHALTGGCTRDVAYLTWIGVVEGQRNQGLGAEFLRHLVQFLSGRQVRYLHTDTASDNLRAQRFYEKLGFRNEGHTRSYSLCGRS
jgi:ribosomal protein S18 acetylase RimI-like enzyme